MLAQELAAAQAHITALEGRLHTQAAAAETALGAARERVVALEDTLQKQENGAAALAAAAECEEARQGLAEMHAQIVVSASVCWFG